jgi:hypothetical protein
LGTRSEILARSLAMVARAIASISLLRSGLGLLFERRVANLEGLSESILLKVEIPANFRRLFSLDSSGNVMLDPAIHENTTV